MNGYTVFLGPFAGIMVTDVRIIVHDYLILNYLYFAVLARPSRNGRRAVDVSALWPI
jgi:cytosine/uracil/thiamine/allantoin permease